MVSSLRTCVDAAFAVLLAVVLLGVYLADRRSASTGPVEPGGGGDPIAEVPAPVPIKLAVTPAGFDDMGKLLGTLGDGYRFEVVPEKTLADPAACARFDAIFLTCAEAGGPAGSAGTARLAPALREFVNNGGTLYASDLRFDTLATAFPEMVDAEAVTQGVKQNLSARVVSPELRDLLGDEMPLHFDLDGWRPAAFEGETVTVYLKGEFRTTAGVDIDAPLLVKFPVGEGTVVFTSFHNEKQNSALEIKLLKHLVFTTVTASVEATVTRSMIRGGFTLQKTNLLSAAPGDPSMTKSYRHSQPGGLSFSLGFEPRGARLRLEVVSPRGERLVKKGDSTLTLDIPDAAAGSWTYTAAPESLPYPNFPFTLSVGAAGKPAPEVAKAAPPTPTMARAPGSVRFREVLVGQVAVQARPRRIAVSEPQFDDMGKLLKTLGDGYQFETIPMDHFIRPESLDKFDVVFLTCGGLPNEWAESFDGESGREGLGISTFRPDVIKRFGETLRRFVERGGTLYASDKHGRVLLWAFPLRQGGLELREEPLNEMDEAERAWFKIRVPLAKIGTISETLQPIDLSPALKLQFRRLWAAVEASTLVEGVMDLPDSDPPGAVRGVTRWANLPATEDDIKAIAAAILAWEQEFRRAARARSRTKVARVQGQISQAERRLKSLRVQIIPDQLGEGNQIVTAKVVDPVLTELLGSQQIELNFTANAWDPATFSGGDVVEYLRGEYKTTQGTRVQAPLLVKFKEGEGTVIFTSFHNEAQNSRQEEALLKYLVFSAVTAKEQEVADKTMFAGGFSPAKRSLISHSSGQPSVTKIYRSPLLVAPTGDVFEREVQATLVVEAAGAPAGEWRYTVTAIQVPYENFPFSVSVGEGTTSR